MLSSHSQKQQRKTCWASWGLPGPQESLWAPLGSLREASGKLAIELEAGAHTAGGRPLNFVAGQAHLMQQETSAAHALESLIGPSGDCREVDDITVT